jgi:hypothetical protein
MYSEQKIYDGDGFASFIMNGYRKIVVTGTSVIK